MLEVFLRTALQSPTGPNRRWKSLFKIKINWRKYLFRVDFDTSGAEPLVGNVRRNSDGSGSWINWFVINGTVRSCNDRFGQPVPLTGYHRFREHQRCWSTWWTLFTAPPTAHRASSGSRWSFLRLRRRNRHRFGLPFGSLRFSVIQAVVSIHEDASLRSGSEKTCARTKSRAQSAVQGCHVLRPNDFRDGALTCWSNASALCQTNQRASYT